MSREIEYRVQALKVVSGNIRKIPTQSEFEAIANSFKIEYSDIFAINFVSADGMLVKKLITFLKL